MTRIAINGFGRIGRSIFRAAFGNPDFEIVAINDLTSTENLGYLLKYDSTYGRYDKNVEAMDHTLMVDSEKIHVYSEKDPANLPWKKHEVDIVVESTGFFTSDEAAQAHIDAGARRVAITAPARGDGVTTALVGTNDDRFESAHPITCNASCTTNSVAPVMSILDSTYTIQKASMTTVHGYTASQQLVDGPDKKNFRRGRAAAINIIPTNTGAAKAVIQVIPELEGKFSAHAVRIPIITGSLSIITALVEKSTDVDSINKLLTEKASDDIWSRVLKVESAPIVSSDIIGEPYGSIIDLASTSILDGNLIKIFAWYDNESGYTATFIEHLKSVASFIK